jgi:YhcH/YjgK/YiaL family protein
VIVDKIENTHLYACCGDNLAKAFEILKDKTLTEKPDGKYEVDGKNIYYLVQRYQSKPLAEGRFEAHQKCIDIQYVASGEETLGYAPIDGLEIQTPYNPEKDIIFYSKPAKYTPVHLKAGLFSVLYPDDAHMPGRAIDNPTNVLKIVVKVKINA